MKKILTLALAIVMLASFCSVFAVSADEPEMFWLTHYGDSTVEGSGVIFTSEYTGAGWWLHVAFAPVEGASNAYEVVATSNGLADGSATPLAIPEGGFVWAANYGNDYISLGSGDTDYTSPNCSGAIDLAKEWVVGDQFVISGIDLENETVPTSTPDTPWYDDAYVCTATIAPYVAGSDEPSTEPSEPTTETVEEVIEIDGKLDDTGYTKAVWFDKGVWQTIDAVDEEGNVTKVAPVLENIDIKYTTRTDAENIYLAVQVTDEAVLETALDPAAWTQAGATDYRLWFLGDGMETRTFYDLLWDGEKLVPFRQKEATEEMTFALGTEGGVLTLEVKIAKASLNITDSYKMMVTYSAPDFGEGENVGYNAFHMTEFVRGEDGKLPDGWAGNDSLYVAYNVADVALGSYEVDVEPNEPSEPSEPSVPEVDPKDEYAAGIEALVGEALENPSFAIAMDSVTDKDGVVTVTVTVTDIAEGAELTGLFADLFYDEEKMTLTTEADTENALKCITKVPSEAWNENLIHYDEENGCISIGIGMTSGEVVAISPETPLELTFTFQLNEGVEYAGLYIPTASVSGTDFSFVDFYGNGTYEIAELPAEEEPSEDSKPVTGDAGVLVFAVLGLIAICGAAVVVKVRH